MERNYWMSNIEVCIIKEAQLEMSGKLMVILFSKDFFGEKSGNHFDIKLTQNQAK